MVRNNKSCSASCDKTHCSAKCTSINFWNKLSKGTLIGAFILFPSSPLVCQRSSDQNHRNLFHFQHNNFYHHHQPEQGRWFPPRYNKNVLIIKQRFAIVRVHSAMIFLTVIVEPERLGARHGMLGLSNRTALSEHKISSTSPILKER